MADVSCSSFRLSSRQQLPTAFTPLPPGHLRIGVSRSVPRGMPPGYRRMPELSPGPWFRSVTVAEYRRRYLEQLARLDPQATVDRVFELAEDKTPVLVCFESPMRDEQWCHRGFIAQWIEAQLGLAVYEFGLEERGSGDRHPKSPAEYRAV
jgi:uncharacterized protein YeaO (DUF488 family)